MVGQFLANGLRRGDIPVRWGGEEFLALLPGADRAGLNASADDLVDRADGIMYASNHGGRIRVTTDIGELTSAAEVPILGTTIRWELPVHRT